MAIREVLTSFTFEQQRQMINLIGTDVGDASTLLTPTNVLVSGINEIVNGDVDLVNQTHGMDAGSLASPSLYWDAGQGFYKVDANKIGLSTGLAIAGNLEVDGDITFRAGAGSGGTLTFGDLNTDNIVFNAELTSSIVPDSTANYSLGSSSKQWNNLYIDGTASIDTLSVDENSTFTGYLQVDSGDIRVPSTTTTVDLFDDYATTVEAFGAGTAIRLGATTGTLTLRNPTIVGSETTQALFNTVATTVNAFGAATTINMGVAGGGGNTNFNILSDDVVCSGDLNVNGGELLSSSNTVDVFINNTVNIGNSTQSGNTTINNELKLKFDLSFVNASGNNVISIPDDEQNALRIREGSNDYMQFRTDNGNERVVVWKDLYLVGNLDVSGTTTTIDATNLVVEDKNIELGASAAPSDTTADGGGITLKGTTDKTITYNNTDTVWETNIGLKVTGTLTATTGGSFDNEVYINGSDATTQRYLNFNRPTAGEYRATLRRDAWYLGETVQNIGDVTPTGANITLKMNGDAIFAGTITDSMGSLRRLGQNIQSVNYTLVAEDAGKHVRVDAGVTIAVPDNIFAAGDMITIVANSSNNVTIEEGNTLNLYNAADGTTGNKTLAARTVCTILFAEGGSGGKAYISGGGIS
tara:strand:- start:5501 stop:7420 length:1920 start_codon:yes stop_codon:yes gene_type:complete